jgi:1-acyl-sn-glycerol-3-phosphate acyltransferase
MLALRLASLLLLALLLTPLQLLLRRGRWGTLIPRFFLARTAAAFGVEVVVRGTPCKAAGTLFVANHVSWADIPVIGGQLRASFVAKSEVGGWPLVGWLADLSRTVYIERTRPATAGEQNDAIADRLRGGDRIVLFPEGTTSDGVALLPFRSALFATVERAADVAVQPLSIAYTRAAGMPATRRLLPHLAWIGESELAPHAVAFFRLRPVRAELLFHPPVRRSDFADRKALARHCEQAVAQGYRELMRGLPSAADQAASASAVQKRSR